VVPMVPIGLTLSDDFTFLQRAGDAALFPLDITEQFERVVNELARTGVIDGDYRLDVLTGFAEESGIFFVCHCFLPSWKRRLKRRRLNSWSYFDAKSRAEAERPLTFGGSITLVVYRASSSPDDPKHCLDLIPSA